MFHSNFGMRKILFKDKNLILEAIESFKEDLEIEKEDDEIGILIKPFLTDTFIPYNCLYILESKIKNDLKNEGSECEIKEKPVDLFIKILYRYYSKLSKLRGLLKDEKFLYSNRRDPNDGRISWC